jgi:hypothetical protein
MENRMIIRTPAPSNASRAELRRTWRQLSQVLQDPDVELDVEAFAALLSTYKQLRDAGERFDLMLVALMAALERQASDSIEAFEDDTDSDVDNHDADLEGEQGASHARLMHPLFARGGGEVR